MRFHRFGAPALILTMHLAMAAFCFAQAPATNTRGILNYFSEAAPAVPNGSIAQGSLFVMNGRNAGPADPIQVTDAPLSSALAGVSAQVTIAPGADPEAPISLGGVSRIGNGQSPGGTFSCPPGGVAGGTPLGSMTFMWSSVAPLAIPEIDSRKGNAGALIGVTRTVAFK